jgi:cation diffusion facilitator family transporter
MTAANTEAAQLGALANLVLAVVKISAGVLGHTYALVADGVESLADVVSSLVVWGGISVGARPADEDHPYGHGKAEAVAGGIVSGFLLLAAVVITVQAIQEIRRPHHFPAPWTLLVLVAVIVCKAVLARRVGAAGTASGSLAVKADAAHHVSDIITSAAAFIGISIALIGQRMSGDSRWSQADDWAAVLAAGVVAWNGVSMLSTALHELMDRSPGETVLGPLRDAALAVDGVHAIEQLAARRVGVGLWVTVHVHADPHISLAAGHALGGRVKHAMSATGVRVHSVLVHMEPSDRPRALQASATAQDARDMRVPCPVCAERAPSAN